MDLVNNPPTMHTHEGEESRFAGRDWRTISVGEVVDLELVRFVEMDTSVEEATNILITSGSPNVVLLRDGKNSRKPTGTFDYNDLNAYLLLVVGLAQPEDRQSFKELAQKGREGRPIPLRDVKDVGKKEPLITLPHTASLTKAVEILGSGIHRIVVVDDKTENAVGVLTQLRMVEFFWDNERQFRPLEDIYAANLRDLAVGAYNVFAIKYDLTTHNAMD
jgi:CBS domain-containing protein